MRPAILIDTDFQMDVDDVGALALAHALHDAGMLDLLAVAVDTSSPLGPLAVDIVNRACGHRLVIGVRPAVDEPIPSPEYAHGLVQRFGAAKDAPLESALGLYRRMLASAVPGSVTIVSIGFYGNLVELIDSPPDGHSDLYGRALIERAVAETIVMGGIYPEGREFNFLGDIELTRRFLSEWPLPIRFVGFETAHGVITGAELSSSRGVDDPVAVAYSAYNGGERGRDSWDPLTVLVAADPSRFAWSDTGVVQIDAEGVDRFDEVPGGPHRILLPLASPDDIAAEIDGYLRTEPKAVEYRCDS
ncbi:nucleoside hydrolase [Homoserinibacter sp. GY 40078]|uniref:nucleoside hydrolase n=1 Tax=Homoserinibacter sp. GY 40078 TaxID=2603275 RepID=UPI0011C948A3|nr:nucleoside hydrolase [Homoserinibacter sp. GY 40078]TXK18483.1 hypothetical protein FVQ89_00520 [Homoserinibacter sp. GY 40078]